MLAPVNSDVMFKKIGINSIILATVSSCSDPVPEEYANDQMVYEALFLEIKGDAISNYFIADRTEHVLPSILDCIESRFFEESQLDLDVRWRG